MEKQNLVNATVVKLIERIDSVTSRDVESALQEIVATGARNLICDCAATNYVSSTGLRIFLTIAKTLKKTGGQLFIVCPRTSYVFEVLETAGFTHIIPVFASVEQAAQNAH
jgi:anti-anti-sigma factor